MMNRPIAIVIPNYNRLVTLRACIQSIRDKAGLTDYTIIVADGGSVDGSVEWLTEQDDVELIRMPERGVVNAVNAAIEAAPIDHDIVRIHSDVVVETEGWLALLAESAYSLEGAGIVTGKLVLPDDRIYTCGRSIITGVGIDPRHSYRQRFAPDGGGGGAAEVDAAPGALSYIRREVIDAVGLYDEGYWPQYLEDDDFSLMARRHGFKVWAQPGVKAIHYHCGFTPTTEANLRFGGSALMKTRDLRPIIDKGHSEHWLKKWGFDPRYPDLGEIRRLYGDTEICWRIGEKMRFKPVSWPPTVDMVMVTWNNVKVLKRCLTSLLATRYPTEKLHLHIADNGSSDGTREYLSELVQSGVAPFQITVHELAVNTGVAVGFNWSIVKGDGELVARMDDDVVVTPEWLEVLVEDFKNRPFAGVVGPKILNDNPIHDIQCGPFRMYPSIYAHENEPDNGQADYVARVSHVRGCLNVYRRDTFTDCGLFDLRFSPSQFDDPDHHVSLNVVGYEVLYDGRVGVIHALNSGAGKTEPALSNQWANHNKLMGKWGGEIWKTLEMGIELSREGKYLPENGDTSAFLATLESGAEYPRTVKREYTQAERNGLRAVVGLRERALFFDEDLRDVWVDTLEQGRMMRRDGLARYAGPMLHAMLDLQGWRWEVMRDLALTYIELGEYDRADLMVKRARPLVIDHADLNEIDERIDAARAWVAIGGVRDTHAPADSSAVIGEAPSSSSDVESTETVRVTQRMKVLMVNTFERRVAGGDMHQIKKTAQYLERLGVDVTVSYTAHPDPTGYDVIHAWNLWFPQQTMAQVKGLKVAAPDTPIVMSPIYWDMTEKHWADAMVPYIFEKAKTEGELRNLLRQLSTDTLIHHGRKRSEGHEPNFPGYELYQKEVLKFVDYLLPNSHVEVKNLASKLGVTLPFNVVHNGAEIEIFDEATPDLFMEQYGLRDFVLTVGLIEPRKNQLMLLQALRGTGLVPVVVGRSYSPHYLRLCRKYAPPGTLFIEHMPHQELASAMKAARVFALPSWMECASIANVEAALSGCAMVVSDRTSETEYFGRNAYYCDPANVEMIRDSVVRAHRYYDADAPKRQALRSQFRERFTWDNAARQTLIGYERALDRKRQGGRVVSEHGVKVAVEGSISA